MKEQELKAKREGLNGLLEDYRKQLNEDLVVYTRQFLNANCPVEIKGVYELKENGIKRRGFKRFVIYLREVIFFGGDPMIQVGGWWLDRENVPTKWDTMTVYGISNPALFELSDNQEHELHPDILSA